MDETFSTPIVISTSNNIFRIRADIFPTKWDALIQEGISIWKILTSYCSGGSESLELWATKLEVGKCRKQQNIVPYFKQVKTLRNTLLKEGKNKTKSNKKNTHHNTISSSYSLLTDHTVFSTDIWQNRRYNFVSKGEKVSKRLPYSFADNILLSLSKPFSIITTAAMQNLFYCFKRIFIIYR